MKIVLVDIGNIKPYEGNVRVHDKTVNRLAKHIKRVGFNVPLLVDGDNTVVKGHARLKAAEKLGMKKIPVIVSENSDEKNKLDRILDNQIQSLSRWDYDVLGYELDGLRDYMDELDIEFDGIEIELDTDDLDVLGKDIKEAEEKLFSPRTEDSRTYITIHCSECGGVIKYVRR